MLSKSEFQAEHDEGLLDDRPQRIQQLRDEFAEYCNLTVPRSVADVGPWYRARKGNVTQALNKSDDEADADGDDDAGSDDEAADEETGEEADEPTEGDS